MNDDFVLSFLSKIGSYPDWVQVYPGGPFVSKDLRLSVYQDSTTRVFIYRGSSLILSTAEVHAKDLYERLKSEYSLIENVVSEEASIQVMKEIKSFIVLKRNTKGLL